LPFQKGRAKTGGRRAGTPNKNTVRRRAAQNQTERIVDDVIRRAEAGDLECIRLYLRYLRAPRQTFVGPYAFTPPTNADEARSAILTLAAQLASQQLSLELHDALVDDLKVYLGAVAVDRLGSTGQKFVVVENNTFADLPLPRDDASLATSEQPAPTGDEPAPEPEPEEARRVLPFPMARDGSKPA
jgi:hypothetical protein